MGRKKMLKRLISTLKNCPWQKDMKTLLLSSYPSRKIFSFYSPSMHLPQMIYNPRVNYRRKKSQKALHILSPPYKI
jgi:hypothetical protein